MYRFGGVRRVLQLAVVVLISASSASASAPLLVFDRAAAAPHAFVVAKTARPRALKAVRKRVLRLSLGGVAVGRLRVDRGGNGKLRFEVPNLPPAEYPLVLHGLRNGPKAIGSYSVVEGVPPVRDCAHSVYGRLDDAYVARSLGYGPVKLIGYDPAKAGDPSWPQKNPLTGDFGVKVLLLVERGAVATLSVAAQDRSDIALVYMGRGDYRVVGGDAGVTFVACSSAESEQAYTQFNGGFMYHRPLCAHFTLAVEGRETIPFALPFGKPCALS
jgi:hypothetical protein